jgi:hypothetical protein
VEKGNGEKIMKREELNKIEVKPEEGKEERKTGVVKEEKDEVVRKT